MKNSFKKILTLSFLLFTINSYTNSLYEAIIRNNYEQARLELQTNKFTSQEKSSALIDSLSRRYIQDNIVRLVIDSDVDINLQQPPYYNTILHSVLIRKQYSNEIIEQILNKNPNLNLKNKQGLTPIHYALFYNYNDKIITLLLNKNIDINIQNLPNKTLLHIALQEGYSSEIIEQILNKNPNLNLQGIYGNTLRDIIVNRLDKSSLQHDSDTEKTIQYINLLFEKICYNTFNTNKWTQAVLIKTAEAFVKIDNNKNNLKQILKNIIKLGLNSTLKTSNLNGLNIIEYYQCIHKYLTLYTQNRLNSNNNNNLLSLTTNTCPNFPKIIEKLKLILQELASKTSEEQKKYCLKIKDRIIELLQILQEGTMGNSIEKIFNQPLKQELYN